ncbi:24709_t:CDS:2 [Entrophospora sp. SA101]|nr:23753_t:CDS:2 [Entrophospora sp. SA101]CAJ0763418.1 24709_t:CDS:2 [Entrophospora sp. SA101]CAJ0841781.1 9651_t:CDS:2 [Entrophospora sp. SA101]
MSFEVGTIVFVKLKEFLWWPGLIVNDEDLPEILLKKRPKRHDFDCIKFFGSINYGWINEKNLKIFTKKEANDQIKQIKKKNHLVRAIKQALEYLLSEKKEKELLGNNPVQNDRENVAVNNNNGGGSSGDNVVAGIISKNSIKRLIDYDNDDETNQENSSKLVKRHKNNCKDFTILSTSNYPVWTTGNPFASTIEEETKESLQKFSENKLMTRIQNL